MKLHLLFKIALLLWATAAPLLAQIQAGTSVHITIMGVPPEEKGKIDSLYPVSSSGMVNLPFIGTIRAAGMSPEGLAASIQNAYRSAEIYNSPTIQVVSTTEGAGVKEELVHIGGQVRRPGPVKFTSNLTIYQAIQAAGGPTEFGSMKRVKLYRSGKPVTYDVTEPEFMKLKLRPDDTIAVPSKDLFGR